MKNEEPTVYNFVVAPTQTPLRIDRYITAQLPTHSRSFLQKLFEGGYIIINDKPITKASFLVQAGDALTITIPPAPPLGIPKPLGKDLGVKVVAKHPHFLIIDKPAGLMVHAPDTTNKEVTLVDWLLTFFRDLAQVGPAERPGIVHRLDKDTSGIMVIARNSYALATLGDMFKNRLVHKTYHALVKGHPPASGTITLAIGRNPTTKYKMTHFDNDDASSTARNAVTSYRVLEYFNDCALIEARPKTGRTHQIRVHCAALGHPILGDTTYGVTSPLIKRQALHAHALSFNFEGTEYSFSAEIPNDFQEALNRARSTTQS